MQLLTAHRILIASASVFFVVFAVIRGVHYTNTGELDALLNAVAGLFGSLGLAIYYRRIGSS